jgi:hypothetical protein
MGIPFVPISGSRGCWGACSFCSITSFYRDARAHGRGPTLRHRSPESIAAEMALRLQKIASTTGDSSGRAIFCFHDENFLMPRPAASAARIRAIRQALDAYGLSGRIGMVGKCRPDSITPQLACELRDLGVIRLYVGVENVSEPGAAHLNRSAQTRAVEQALAACREAGIFGCYNLLIFEPSASITDVEQNLAFIRSHAEHPVNFCRAEPYHGTPMMRALSAAGNLTGSYLGYDYRIADDRAELLFRICAAVFRERNFAALGVHNRTMGLGYDAQVLSYFYDDPAATREVLADAARISRGIVLETASFLEEAIALARDARPGDAADRDRIERETALLGLRIAEADRYQHARLDEVYEAMDRFVSTANRPAPRAQPKLASLVKTAKRLARGVALGALLTAWSSGTAGCEDKRVTVDDDAGKDAGDDGPTVSDWIPHDAGVDAPIYDPLPPDASIDGPVVVDDVPPDAGVDAPIYDPLPPDASLDGPIDDPLPPDAAVDAPIYDPLPPDASLDGMVIDWVPPDASLDGTDAQAMVREDAEAVVATSVPSRAQWRDTAPRRTRRSDDLPLCDPPAVRLVATAAPRGVLVRIVGGPEAISTRWESDGAIDGDGREVLWGRQWSWRS